MGRGKAVGALCAMFLTLGSAAAYAAGPGETFMVGGLAIPPGSLPAGGSGIGGFAYTMSAVSADGRYVAFTSQIDALSAIDDDDTLQLYRRDRVTGEVVLVSRATGAAGAPAAGNTDAPSISADGSRIAFLTDAPLDPADADGKLDVYVRDLNAQTTELITPGTPDPIASHDLSPDGFWVAFSTATSLAGADANGKVDVYRRAVGGGAPALVSQRNAAVQAGNDDSFAPSISPDGRYIAYSSRATDIVAGFVDNSAFQDDVYLRDMNAGPPHTRLVNARFDNATQSGNGGGGRPQVAVDGATVHVAFESSATNLVDNAATDGSPNVSVYRKKVLPADTLTSVLISRADGVAGANADSRAHSPSISTDGRRVAFTSDATNLGPANVYYNTYVRDVVPGTTRRVSVNSGYEVEAALSGDGNHVVWGGASAHPDLDPFFPGVFGRALNPDASLGAVELVSRPAGGASLRQSAIALSDSADGARSISADGRYVLLPGSATGLPASGVDRTHVYRRDTLTGEVVLVSRAGGADGAPADRGATAASMSADGNRVIFSSSSTNLDPAADGSKAQVFLRDIAAGTTTLISRGDGQAGAPASGGVADYPGPAISADGGTVAFVSNSNNLGAPGGTPHVFARRVATSSTVVVDRADGPAGAIANNGGATGIGVSGDGSRVVFDSQATNLGFAGAIRRVYVRDVIAGTTRMVSRLNGEAGASATEASGTPVISTNGQVVAFVTTDDALAPEAGAWPGGTQQLVARDLSTHQNRLISRAAGDGAVANRSVGEPTINADGGVIAFATDATNLLPGRGGAGRESTFVRTTATGALAGPPAFGRLGGGPQFNATNLSISDNGSCLFFGSPGHTATGLGVDYTTGYVYVVSGECTSRLGPEPAPPAGPAPPPGPGTPIARPALTKVSLLNPVFRVGKRVQVLTAAQRRKRVIPTGTRFRFTLSADAAMRIVLQQRLPGRRVGKACRAVTSANRSRRACVRFVPKMSIVRASMKRGARSIAFTGRLGSKRLTPGRYRAVLRAVNSGGASAPVNRAFRVVR